MEKMTVVQCWDDGVTGDARLTEILRKHNAKATFNLNAGRYKKGRSSAEWSYKGQEVLRLGWDEMKEVYDGFTIANHSLTHPRLPKISLEDAKKDILEG
ncbi:MAG TPA: polysaccharide deacetylase family protein [Victivallales bacterium]|nr:polysaccharide deacetylase family protein [Victivallales bacterium]